MFQLTPGFFQHTALNLQEADSTFSVFSQKAVYSSMVSLNLNFPPTERTQLSIPTCSMMGAPATLTLCHRCKAPASKAPLYFIFLCINLLTEQNTCNSTCLSFNSKGFIIAFLKQINFLLQIRCKDYSADYVHYFSIRVFFPWVLVKTMAWLIF